MGEPTRPKARPNRKTDETTAKGRPVWIDGTTGEKYSERSVTFPVEEGGKEVWYTFPTVAEDGTQYDEDTIREHVRTNGPIDWITGEALPNFKSQEEAVNYAKKRSGSLLRKTQQYAKGGEVTQMDKMMEEGGLATDGMDVDPVSGNEIPVGSNASDVRDDVDVKLSEGEYVVPADVVKYIGVSTLEKMVNKAKDGLEEMGENGRIGGEPVATPEAKEELLEHTLSSDLEELDGYAAGGLVPGADINGIIDRVKGAAAKDPSIVNMLKAKGIFIQDAGPQAQPAAIQGMAEGGVVQDGTYRSSFDPSQHQMGFSYTGYQSNNTETPAYKTEATEKDNSVTCPPGYRFNATTNSCEIDPDAQTPRAEEGGPQDNTEVDENAGKGWMGSFDYGDPDALAEATMSTLSGEGSFGSKALDVGSSIFGGPLGVLGAGVIGKAMAGKAYSEAMANSAALAAQGHTAQAKAIEEAAKSFAKSKNLNTNGLFTSGLAKKTAQAIEAISKNGKAPKGSPTTSTSTGTTTAPTSTGRVGRTAADYRGLGTNAGDRVASQLEASARTGKSIAEMNAPGSGGYDSPEGRGTAGQASGGAQQGGTGSVGVSGNDGRGNGVSGASDGAAGAATGGQGDQGQGSGWGGMAKGGLVAPRPSKKKMEKKPTVKKGLGRK